MPIPSRSSFFAAVAVVASAIFATSLTGCAANSVNANAGKAAAPTVLNQPASQTVLPGQAAGFSVTVVAYGTVTYQWYLNGVAVAGATNNTFVLSSVTTGQNGATVYVVVTSPTGSVSSNVVTLSVGNSLPTGSTAEASLACSSSSPGYGATIMVVPSFAAGKAVIGTGGINSSDISASAASGTTYTTGAITSGQTYTLTVVGAGGNGDTSTITATCKATPTAVTVASLQPNGTTVAPGSISFTATAAGGATNNVNWSASAGSFSGNVWTAPMTPGAYTITATSADNPSVHGSATINVSGPMITKQPASVAACTNAATTLAVTANYASSYQWYLGGNAIAGATASSYLVPAASSTDAGAYTVAVTNGAGTVTSQAVNLSVGSSLTANPVSATVGLLQPTTFAVTAAGKSPFSYQWFVEPVNASGFLSIPGATSSSYNVTAVSDSSGNQYYAVVKDACGTSFTSTPATLTLKDVPVPPIITLQPVSSAIPVGGSVTLTTNSTSAGTTSYQWYRVPAGTTDSLPIPGATSVNYTVPASSTNITNDQDGYYQTITNSAGLDVSATATIAVGQGILIRKGDQPATVYESPGEAATFSVNASSTLPMSYQWYQAAPGSASYSPIDGANASSYTIGSTMADQNGSSYYVVVSNGVTAPVTSAKASLFVGQFPQATNLCDQWQPLGYATQQANCSYLLTPAKANVVGGVMFPKLVPASNMQLSFTITTSGASSTPGEGFAIVIGDPTLGATPKSIGSNGLGLGAEGIPGFAITFDVDSTESGPKPPFLGTTFSQASQWANPWMDLNTTLAGITTPGVSTTHTINVSVLNDAIDVLMDGMQIFHGDAALPPTAYIYLTAGNGTNYEQVVVSNLTAIFSPQ